MSENRKKINKNISSVLRYPGGKSKALKKISCLIPRDINEYREPFVGGGSVFVRVKQNIEKNVVFKINDINPDLYLFWRCIQQDGERFQKSVFSMKKKYKRGKELYEYYKENNQNLDNFEKAIRFFIMNRITFSGLIDSGGFSQQSYDYRFTDSIINKITPLSGILSDVEISNYDYRHLLRENGKNVFLFLDPPYLSAKDSSLYGKNGDLHKVFDHEKFAEEARKCSHKWLITCDDTPEIRELFEFAEIIPWNLKYGMTSVRKTTLTKGNEIFIFNYDLKEIDPISDDYDLEFNH